MSTFSFAYRKALLLLALSFGLISNASALSLVKTVPSEGQTKYPTSSKIVLQFSESMRLGKGNITLNGTAITPTITSQFVLFAPTLNYLTDYTLEVPDSALVGASGAYYPGTSLHFKTAAEPMPSGCDVGVSKDGSYQFSTIQEAIDAAPSNSDKRYVIFIKEGTYEESIRIPVEKKNLTLWGQHQMGTILSASAPAKPILTVSAEGCYLYNLTVRNTATTDSAGALTVEGDQVQVRYCTLSGTHQILNTGRHRSKYYQCTFLGKNALLRSEGNALFEQCHFCMQQAGTFIESSTALGVTPGVVLTHCRLLTAESGSYLAKALTPNASVCLRECALPSGLSTTGWDTGVYPSPRFTECMNFGPGATPHSVVYLTRDSAESLMNRVLQLSSDAQAGENIWDPDQVLATTGYKAATWKEGEGYGANRGGNGGITVTVDNEADLVKYMSSADRYIIRVKGILTLSSEQSLGSDKTLTGMDASSTIIGNIRINSDARNVIVRNLNITHPGDLKANDGISMEGAHKVLVEHVSFYDCSDGECDMRNGSDSITLAWNKMYYVKQTDGHRFTMICDGVILRDVDGNTIGFGKPIHTTFHHNWWSTLCDQRMPSSTNAHAHLFNCYWNATGNSYCSLARENSEFFSENNYYQSVSNPLYKGTFTSSIYSSGNIFNACSGTIYRTKDNLQAPAYTYTLAPASDVPATVSARAGNYWFDASYQPTAIQQPSIENGQPQILNAGGKVRIQLSSNEKATVSLYDLQGRKMHQETLTQNATIEIGPDAAKGLCILKLDSGKQSFSQVVTLY